MTLCGANEGQPEVWAVIGRKAPLAVVYSQRSQRVRSVFSAAYGVRTIGEAGAGTGGVER